MKNALIARRACGAALAAAVCLATSLCGAASTVSAQTGQESVAVGATMLAAKPLVLPTNAQVIAAVAQAVNVKTLSTQPPTLSQNDYGCLVYYTTTTMQPCIYGDPTGSHSIVLYGDSHAANWIAAFDTIGKYLHWKVWQITKAQCPVPDFPSWDPTRKRLYTECTAFHTFAIKRITQLHPDVVVMSSEGQGPYLVVDGRPTRQGVEAAWGAGLATVIDAIKPVTRKVIVLGDFAYGIPAGRDCLAAHKDDIRACNLVRSRAVGEAHNHMEQRTAQQHGALYVATVPWFCTATVCPAVVDGYSTRNDGFHVTPSYAVWLSEVLAVATGLLPVSHAS
jgi:SGNH domain (fused to AT3 domains)